MTLAPVRPRCTRCGGTCLVPAFDGPVCLQCGRPLTPVVPVYAELEPRFDVELKHTIAAQRSIIDRCVAAGKRAWS